MSEQEILYIETFAGAGGACLSGFPTNYKFYGSHTSRCEQIGNAISVNLAYHIGLSIKKYLHTIY